jgi:hypothetical protein
MFHARRIAAGIIAEIQNLSAGELTSGSASEAHEWRLRKAGDKIACPTGGYAVGK